MSTLQVALQNRLGDFRLNVQFEVPLQGVTALFGQSGCGKTSVLRALAGLTKTESGRISVNGSVWQDKNVFLPAHTRPVGYVFQEASLFPHMSVHKNLTYGLDKIPTGKQKIRLDDAIGVLGIEPLLQRASTKLSGGERQRVAIARALLTSPELMLMDEPLSALDHHAKQSILPYLEQLQNQFGIPSVYVSHDANEVARLATHMVYMSRGEVVAAGQFSELLSNLDLPMAVDQDATAVLQGQISSYDHTFDMTAVGLTTGQLQLTHCQLPVGSRVRVQIRASDVSLSLKPHTDTSIVNILPVQIIGTHDIDRGQTVVRLQLPDGQTLLSRVTRRSAMSLELKEGMYVYAQVKGVALV